MLSNFSPKSLEIRSRIASHVSSLTLAAIDATQKFHRARRKFFKENGSDGVYPPDLIRLEEQSQAISGLNFALEASRTAMSKFPPLR